MKLVPLWLAAACGLLASVPASASEAELKALREEIAQMKQLYEKRIDALEKRLSSAEQTAAPAATAAGNAATSFNPEVSLILQGAMTSTRRDPATWTLQGFVPPGAPDEVGPPRRRGLSLGESELVFSANVDPNFRGYLNLALAPDNTVAVEEAYFQSLALGSGLTLKGGRFLSGIGYQNEQHPHSWDFADAPLAYTAFFGNRLSAEGVQLKWLAPTETYLELGLEAGRDDGFPGGGKNKGGSALGAAFAHVGGDVDESNSWRIGLSHVGTTPGARSYNGIDATGLATSVAFAGKSRTTGADFVWKWAPNGNPKEHNFKFQAEYFQRDEDGRLSCAERDTSGACGGAAGVTGRYRSRQSGYYVQGVWQFMPRWRVGYRHDRLDAGATSLGPALSAADLPQLAAWKPRRDTLMVDWSSSEFARLRFQVARDDSRGPGLADTQLWLQYIMSIGAHGAHKF